MIAVATIPISSRTRPLTEITTHYRAPNFELPEARDIPGTMTKRGAGCPKAPRAKGAARKAEPAKRRSKKEIRAELEALSDLDLLRLVIKSDIERGEVPQFRAAVGEDRPDIAAGPLRHEPRRQGVLSVEKIGHGEVGVGVTAAPEGSGVV